MDSPRVFRVRQTGEDRFTLERLDFWPGVDAYCNLTHDQVKPLADELVKSGAAVRWELAS